MKETFLSISFDTAPLVQEKYFLTSVDNFGPWRKIDPRQIMKLKVKRVSVKVDYLALHFTVHGTL